MNRIIKYILIGLTIIVLLYWFSLSFQYNSSTWARIRYQSLARFIIPSLTVVLLVVGIHRLLKPARRGKPIVLNQNSNGHSESKNASVNFPLKLGDRIAFVMVDEIACFYAQDNHVYLYDMEGKQRLVEYTLADLEQKLPAQFIRVHRSTIVNSHLIQEIKKQPGSRFAIRMRDAKHKEVISGQSYAAPVKQLFEI